jgi:hypothetical protein
MQTIHCRDHTPTLTLRCNDDDRQDNNNNSPTMLIGTQDTPHRLNRCNVSVVALSIHHRRDRRRHVTFNKSCQLLLSRTYVQSMHRIETSIYRSSHRSNNPSTVSNTIVAFELGCDDLVGRFVGARQYLVGAEQSYRPTIVHSSPTPTPTRNSASHHHTTA